MAQGTPTILVKKADGTYVRMTLDEVRRAGKGGTAPAPVKTPPAEKSVATPSPAGAAAKVDPKPAPPPAPKAPTPAPVEKPTAPKPSAAAGAPKNNPPLASPSRDAQIETIMNGLSFSVGLENTNRLRTIIQLYIKEVRTVDDTRSVLLRPVLDGGLGMTRAQADEVIQKSDAAVGKKSTRLETLKKTGALPPPSTAPAKASPPAVSEANIPAPATPYNAFRHDAAHMPKAPAMSVSPRRSPEGAKTGPVPVKQTPLPPASSRQSAESATAVPLPTSTAKPPQPKPSPAPLRDSFTLSRPAGKPMVHDVVAPPDVTLTPVDEIRSLTLVDLRRLSKNPDEAATRLKQKFMNIQSESILLYLDALKAWRQSPLYHEYLRAVGQALTTGVRLPVASAGKADAIQFPEIAAVVKMESGLEYL